MICSILKRLMLAGLFLILAALPTYAQLVTQPIPDKLVVLTFDDAVSTHATFVAPLLKKYGFGGTFFVCEFPPDFDDKRKYMRWEQIQELSEMGFEIGNHTWHHTHLNEMNEAQLNEELAFIEKKCAALGIEKPVSFAYPAYLTDPKAIEILKARGYQWARVGGGLAYEPEKQHPYLIPSASTTGDDKARVMEAIQQAKDGKIVVLTVHGVPDYAHDWVTTPPALFEEYLQYLKDNDYTVIALKDLVKYVDPEKAFHQLKPEF